MKKKKTYNEIYKILSFEKIIKIDHNKIILYTKYNSIVITSSVKEHKTLNLQWKAINNKSELARSYFIA